MQKFFALILTLFLPVFVFSLDIEKPTGFLLDKADIFSSQQRDVLENKISEFEKNTGNEISVVSVNSLDGDSIENVAQSIFDKWKIGKTGKDNGLLILISVSDRQIRIHTGYGLEAVLPDLLSYKIQTDIMIPKFKEGNFFEGTSLALDEIINIISGGEPTVKKESPKNDNFQFYIFIFFIVFQVIISILSRSKSWWLGGVFGAVSGIGLSLFFSFAIVTFVIVTFVLILIGLLIDFIVSKGGGNGLGGGGFWGGFGGGGSGGGFGGFGGGFSGGGGSSSRW